MYSCTPQRYKAITWNPVDFYANSAKRRNSRHYPLTVEQVAAVAASVGERYSVYELLTLFAAYTGLRAEETAGCEVADLVVTGKRAHIDVRRAKKRRGGEWIADDHKSAKSRRTGAVTGLARGVGARLPRQHLPGRRHAYRPIVPNQVLGGARRQGCRAVAPLEFSEPVDPGASYKNLLRPALEAVGLPTSRPATKDAPAVQGVRLHDRRHTFVTLQLSAGCTYASVEVAGAQHFYFDARRVRRLGT